MSYIIEGLDPNAFAPLWKLGDAELRARGVHRYRADKRPGYPCRVTLEDAEPGQTLLLLNHESRSADTPYRARHAIFVLENVARAACFIDAIPPVMRERRLSLRGFDAEGMMADAALAEPGEADRILRTLFDNPMIVEVDVHNAIRGCFSARARRA